MLPSFVTLTEVDKWDSENVMLRRQVAKGECQPIGDGNSGFGQWSLAGRSRSMR